MRTIAVRLFSLLLASVFVASSVVMAEGNAVNDAFDSLANTKGGAKKAPGLDALDDIARGKGNNDAGTGHGIDVGIQSIATNRANQKILEAETTDLAPEKRTP